LPLYVELYSRDEVAPVFVLRYPIGAVKRNEHADPTELHAPDKRYCHPLPVLWPTAPSPLAPSVSEKCTSTMNGEALAVPQPVVSSNCKMPLLLLLMFVVVVSIYWNPLLLLK